MLARLNYVTGRPDDIEVSQRQADYELALAQVDDAQRKLERLKDGADPVDLASVESRIAAAQATLNQSRIIAPFAGVVTLVKPMVGDQTAPGLQAFRVDDLSRMLVDVQISEVDINSVSVDQPVTLIFDAALGREYTGKVVEVGQVGSVVSGAVNFTVTVELLDPDEQVRPGMTAAVNITVREVDNVLIVPNRAVRMVDGARVVYILRDGAPVKVEIRLGATSDLVSEAISDDLKEGDLVILNPPVSSFGGGPPGGGGMRGGGGGGD